MQGRHLAIGLLALLLGAVALIFYIGATGGGRRDGGTGDPPPVSFTPPKARDASASDAALVRPRAEARTKRDELRRKILEAWAAGDTIPAGAEDAKRGRFQQHPNADGYGIDPAYIQAAIREQMYPMLEKCYEDLLARSPDAGGRVQLWFKIVGDDKLGGLVEEDEDADGGNGALDGDFGDEKMRTCVRESLLTVTFPPPAKDGVVTVGYPITLDPDRDGGP